MICVSIKNKTCEEIIDILDRPEVEMAEIRLDKCDLSDEEIDDIFSGTDIPLIATCRVSSGLPLSVVEHRLTVAVEAGANFVDMEIEAPAPLGKRIGRLARESGSLFIRSYHNPGHTPELVELQEILDKCRRFGGEMVKIVTKAQLPEDVETVRALYNGVEEGRLVAFCMGAAGRESRIACLGWGAPFTYASAGAGQETAEGQIPLAEMSDIVYGDAPVPPTHSIHMPASKSFAQRAIIAAALADGTSHLGGFSSCDDTQSAIAVARAIGAKVHKHGPVLQVEGIGPVRSLQVDHLDVGESGLLARLMIPLLARLCDSPVMVTGSGTLPGRPLSDATDIMASFGVMLENRGRVSRKEVFVPLEIKGRLLAGRADISGRGGSQLISGLLMALPLAEKNSAVFVHDPRSIPYMFVTVDVLRKFGIQIANEMEGGEEFVETGDWSLCTAMNFKIKGGQSYHAADFDIEGDWSSAAAYMVAGAVFGGAHLTGLDTSSLQADLSVMDILVDAGASVSQDEDGTINVLKAPLSAFVTDLNNAPDLFPVIAVLAAFCPGQSRIAGVGRLAGKESDRAGVILEFLAKMGVEAAVEGDEMLVEGHSLAQRRMTGTLLKGGEYSAHHDHRIAMALKLASMGMSEPLTIDDTDCVSKSYPAFMKDFSDYFNCR